MIEVEFEQIPLSQYLEMRKWCKTNFGRAAWYYQQLNHADLTEFRWHSEANEERNKNGGALFTFRTEQDASWFNLVWL